MKLITKIAALVAASTALVASLTGCPANDVTDSVGKDYFYGTWVTTEQDETNTDVASALKWQDVTAASNNFHHYYKADTADTQGAYYHVVMWNFNGKSENISDGGIFRQRIRSYKSIDTTTGELKDLVRDNLAYGAYDINGNSSYSKGKLFLQYQYLLLGRDIAASSTAAGTAFTDAQIETLDKLYEAFWLEYAENGKPVSGSGWTEKDILGFALREGDFNSETKYSEDISDDDVKEMLKFADGGKLADATLGHEGSDSKSIGYYAKNGVWIYVKNIDGTLKSSDTEYFRFVLADESTSGYTRMKASAYNKDNKTIGLVYDGWFKENADGTEGYKNNGKYSSKYGYPVKTGTTWTGALTRYMGRYSTYKNEYLYNTGDKAKSNADLFKDIESSDSTDYTEPDGEVK